MHLLVLVTQIYDDARSTECQITFRAFNHISSLILEKNRVFFSPEGEIPIGSPIRAWQRNVIIDSKIAGSLWRRSNVKENGRLLYI